MTMDRSPSAAGPGPVVGLDVGGTKIAALVVDDTDRVLARIETPTDGRPIGEQAIAVIRSALDAAGGEVRPAAVGIGAPGQVDSATGVLRMAVNLALADVPLAALVHEALDVPVFVDHDTRAAAAWLLQDGTASRSMAYLSVGTGISAAVVVDGRLVRGSRGLAGEIGHLSVVPDGPPCACGLHGCLEAVAAGPAIARAAVAAVARGDATAITPAADAREVYRAAAAGDPVAAAIVAEVGAHLARAVRGLVLAYGVERVVIGGGLSRAGATFLQPILDELARERAASALVRVALPDGAVELLPPDADAGAWGGVVIARSGLRAVRSEPGWKGEVGDA